MASGELQEKVTPDLVTGAEVNISTHKRFPDQFLSTVVNVRHEENPDDESHLVRGID